MKYFKQFGILLLIAFLGELLNACIPLPIPASIYGIVLLFFGLQCKIIRLEQVRDVSKFLVAIMPVMFIPAAVGLLDSWNVVAPSWLPYLCITFVTTFVVMGVSGRTTQWMIRKKRGGREEHA